MKVNKIAPVLAQNQNSGISHPCTIGSRNTAAINRNTRPNAVRDKWSRRRAGCAAWYSATTPASAKIKLGARLDPYRAGQGAIHPPRNSSVAMALTVTMLAYSAIKNEANFMLLYSV